MLRLTRHASASPSHDLAKRSRDASPRGRGAQGTRDTRHWGQNRAANAALRGAANLNGRFGCTTGRMWSGCALRVRIIVSAWELQSACCHASLPPPRITRVLARRTRGLYRLLVRAHAVTGKINALQSIAGMFGGRPAWSNAQQRKQRRSPKGRRSRTGRWGCSRQAGGSLKRGSLPPNRGSRPTKRSTASSIGWRRAASTCGPIRKKRSWRS